MKEFRSEHLLILAQRLRNLRSKYGVRQEDIAAALNLSFRSYSNYERGYRMPDISVVRQLARYYNVSIDYLLGETSSPERYVQANNLADDVLLAAEDETRYENVTAETEETKN